MTPENHIKWGQMTSEDVLLKKLQPKHSKCAVSLKRADPSEKY